MTPVCLDERLRWGQWNYRLKIGLAFVYAAFGKRRELEKGRRKRRDWTMFKTNRVLRVSIYTINQIFVFVKKKKKNSRSKS